MHVKLLNGRFVNIIGLVFGIDNMLGVVKTKVARQHITEGDCQKIIRHTFVTE